MMMRMTCFLFCMLLPMTVAAVPVQLVVLDVAEGQAVLVQQGEYGILLDTGHAGKARGVLDRLGELGVQHLDYLILTHLHPDHASGYFRLREAWPDVPVLYNGQVMSALGQPDMVRWVYDALLVDAKVRMVGAGERINWRQMQLEILWPDGLEGHNINQNSLVIKLDYADKTVLLMGDADIQVEQAMLKTDKLPASVDILVLGHHGAKDASSEAFLRQLNPELAIISVNKNNLRGYPDASVLQRLQQLGIKLHRTDRDGELIINLNTP